MNHLFSGISLSFLSLATLGCREKIASQAMQQLSSFGFTAVNVYDHFLKFLNPQAHIPQESLFGYPLQWINNQALHFSKSSNPIKKHVISRGAYLVLALSSPIIRLAEAAIGLVAALFSCLTLGNFPRLNKWAFGGLRFPLVLRDLFFSAMNFLHPGSLII